MVLADPTFLHVTLCKVGSGRVTHNNNSVSTVLASYAEPCLARKIIYYNPWPALILRMGGGLVSGVGLSLAGGLDSIVLAIPGVTPA
jgi:hypothetical protein